MWILVRSIAELVGLCLMGSVSLRSARIDTVYDYELVARVETHHIWAMELREREDGGHYRGQDYGFRIWLFQGRHFKNEAKGIDAQEISIAIPRKFEIGNIKIEARAGIGRAYERWKDPHNVLVAGLENKVAEVGYSSDFSQVHRLNMELRPEIPITEKLSITPTLRYEKRNERVFWQFKIFGKYSF